jgi:hypothetical protein
MSVVAPYIAARYAIMSLFACFRAFKVAPHPVKSAI